MLLSTPQIDFEFDGAAKIATKLPLIKTKIKTELEEELSKEIIHPQRVILPLSWSADPELVWHRQVSGVLRVRLRNVSGLPSKGSIL